MTLPILSIAGFVSSLAGLITDPLVLAFIVTGTVIGMVIGAIPGLGGAVALTLLIPITFGLDPITALAFLAAAKGGVIFSGSITAILLNTPGSPANTATLLDGHPMARNGDAGIALGASAFGSASGAIIGIIILVLLMPVIKGVAIMFGPPEFFLLTMVGIFAISVAISGSVLAGLVGGALGFMMSFTGYNPITGSTRFTFGSDLIVNGYPLIPAIIGIFAIAEAISLASSRGTISESQTTISGSRIEGIREVLRHKFLFVQSAVIGFVVGAIPAVGGSVAGFVSYVQAMNISRDPDSFGSGNIAGLIATESANDAKDAGDLVPTLALGIPGSAGAAVLLGAFRLHGLNPGPQFLVENLDVAYAIFGALIISNILTSVIGLYFADTLAKTTQISTPPIAVFIVAVSLPGAYAIRNLPADILIAIGFGILGFLFTLANISRIAFIIAMVLGPIAEQSFHQAIQIARGDYVSAFTSPLSIALLVFFLLLLIAPMLTRSIIDNSL